MREANTAIIRGNHEMLNMETLLYGANGMKHGAKLDLNSAFEQVRLKKECRYIYLVFVRTTRSISIQLCFLVSAKLLKFSTI